jgi:phosphatidylglycerol:prolipoprotein diacylglycerol transferase
MHVEFPVVFRVAGFSVSAHLILETLAFIVGYQYYVKLRSNSNDAIADGNRIWIFIGATAGAFIFSRIIGALESPSAFFSADYPMLYLFSSKTIIGGLLGGLLGVELIKKIIGEKNSSGDLFTFPLILAMIIGRTGCFLNGIYEPTFGMETSWFTGMNLGDGKLRHPVALYEIIFLVLLWMALIVISKKTTLASGEKFKLFMIAYLAFRFFLEFIKPREIAFSRLSTIQICCLAGLIYYRKTIYTWIFKPFRIAAYGQ